MKALFTYDYGQEKMDSIRALGYELLVVDEKNVTYSEEMQDVEVLVCYNPFRSLDIKKMRDLKWIQLSSIGIDQAPVDVIKEQGMILTNNKGGYSIPMGEWVVLKILEIYKQTHQLYEQQQLKTWKMRTGLLELYGKKVAFIGTGSIAVESAKRLRGFEAKVIGVNTEGTEAPYFEQCYPVRELEEVLKISDVVVLTIPYTKETHHLINEVRLKEMKKDAVLINVSRGSIIDEKALIKHMQEGNLLGVALDVFEEEPLWEESPLWKLDNVIVTPHNSWISEMRNERRFSLIYENLKRYSEENELVNVLNLAKGY
ncbi:D-isomer specific 2-hydroxyacid dehydrogenase, NAD-binding [Alkaliphilus metalliredigens QYMF]|uniref:D-isomer specific 2-hydroxyacid dehydrogenase, NAD-binding n=1 Tax=Alkaliphilus metalliredigens (strain QYMF) TaxID=293826 RepID=A6TUE2_ALKMQ|nr:D-isomer specific 2-hydroxyacid dehydrogenase, NAD-binding [Alkaliphilus metalliredigens QYMF]